MNMFSVVVNVVFVVAVGGDGGGLPYCLPFLSLLLLLPPVLLLLPFFFLTSSLISDEPSAWSVEDRR